MLYVRFDRLFREVVEASPGAVVAYEQQSNRFIGSAHVGLGIIAHLQRACEELSVPYTGVTYSTIKKLATGSGVAKKEAMVAAALKRWPELPADTTDDEADALWSAECARTGMV
jgi:Holliday junction resolvasome RuvABC endonuclease subunit